MAVVTTTYGQIRDYLNHRVFQNLQSEIITNSDIAIAINLGQMMLLNGITSPTLNNSFELELSSEGTTFAFDYDFKRIYKVYGLKDGETVRNEIKKQVFVAPEALEDDNNRSGLYEYRAYQNTIITGDAWKTIIVQGERFLADIEDTDDWWNTVFPLGPKLAGVLSEYCMALLLPANLAEGYNLSQYHETLYNKMLRSASGSLAKIAGSKTIENDVH